MALECDICAKWCHQVCGKTNKSNFGDAILQAVEGADGASICWFCPKCKTQKDAFIVAMRDVSTFKSAFETRLSAIEAKLATAENPSAGVMPNGLTQEVLQGEIAEALERESKKLNLVVVGLPESDKTKARCDADKNFVHQVAAALDINTNNISEVFRSGAVRQDVPASGYPYARVLKVKFVDRGSRLSFLRGFKGAKPPSAASLKTYVRPDMTFRERQLDRELRTELLRRRLTEPDLVIFRGKIVKKTGQPQNQT